MSSNKLVVCPYDEAHKVKESRIQLHIAKCKKNHQKKDQEEKADRFICPFNATHVCPKQEKGYHLSRCPDRAVMDRLVSAPINQNNPFKGRTAVPSYSEPTPVDSDEVWEVEEMEDGAAGYRPTVEAPLGTISYVDPWSKPASRRQLYKELHQMPSELDKRTDYTFVPPNLVPRQPKQPSEAERNFEEQGANSQHLGLGRGKPPPTSRIAANIFSQQPEVGNAVPARGNYSAVITGMKNLGVGRGIASQASSSRPILNDEDFPALGLGRGAARNTQRQDFKAPGSRW